MLSPRFKEYRLEWEMNIRGNTWRRIEECLYMELSTLTRWHIFINPERLHNGGSRFFCSVGYKSLVHGHRQTIEAELQSKVSLNAELISNIDGNNEFSSGDAETDFKWDFDVPFLTPGVEHVLLVDITFAINVRHFANYSNLEIGNMLWLSNDLNVISCEKGYSMMRLFPSDMDDCVFVEVHPFILYSRWKNFNRVHDIRDWAVRVDISHYVLSLILVFLYSGTLPYPLRNFPYIVEVFHIIEKYDLYILYKMFYFYPELEHRVDRYESVVFDTSVSLTFRSGMRIDATSARYRRLQFPIPNERDLALTVTVEDVDGIGPWLSYYVSTGLIMDLDYEICITVTGDGERTILAHYGCHTIKGPSAIGASRVLFLGSRKVFGGLLSDDGLILGINVTHSSAWPRTETLAHSEVPFPGIDISLGDLVTDLWGALKLGLHTDMRVIPRGEPPETEKGTHCHRFMFRARFEAWDNIISEGQMRGNDIPTIQLQLNEVCVEWLLRFMYTAEARRIPRMLKLELIRFTVDNEFESLRHLLSRSDFQELFARNLLRSRHD
ncbi:hypothetical protein CEXT_366251 [Caerostris extrusa]|uniref:BTB domain-containing protein n=1 Tax=Caerostris extrusa TaxID=172846 RepID=A0AAV4P7N2_CAEEX|nr:hypothetical protein CEXT_366251 [Caerostris extrusa]